MDEDKISSLPEHVKHHIFSFISSIKEAARTSSLSKSWLRTWRSFQITDFNPCCILPESALSEFRERGTIGMGDMFCERYIKFVDDALLRSRDGMPRFSLHASAEMAPHLDRWLGMALDYRVEDLILIIMRQIDGDLPYSIPKRVLSADFIRSLTFCMVKIDGISAVSLPALRSLHLSDVYVDNQMFQRLLGGCPLLEDLSVGFCRILSEIEVSNLDYLKKMIVTRGTVLKVISIKAPSLESFCIHSQFQCEQDTGLVVDLSPNVRCLELSNVWQTEEWFCRLLSKLPLLESLRLDGCRLVKRIRIANLLLKKLSIENCDNLVDIRIDATKLSSFYYESWKTLPSIWTESSPYNSAVGFGFLSLRDPSALWFQEFQKFLARCSTMFRCPESKVLLYEWDEEMQDEMNQQVVLPAPGIQNLKLVFEASEASYPLILDGLFAACRPTTFLLRAAYPFVKFICEALANKEQNPDCCSGEPKCWKHELKDVKIERLEGTSHQGPLDWCTLLSLLPTVSTFSEVCFRLQW